MYPKKINDLIESFKMFPGIGQRTAERLAFSVLEMEKDNIDYFSDSIISAKYNIVRCEKCNNYSDEKICNICRNNERNKSIICIVDDPKSVFLFEKLKSFDGYYFVLDALISPLDGVGPEDIGINKLLKNLENNNYKEVLMAVKPTIEGETTSLYIKKILSDKNYVVTRIASGVPIGADIEYVDSLTLQKAIEDRRKL